MKSELSSFKCLFIWVFVTHIFAVKGSVELVNYARSPIADHEITRLLLETARQNSVDRYQLLSIDGFDVNARDYDDSSALFIASCGSSDMVRELLNTVGVEVNFESFARQL